MPRWLLLIAAPLALTTLVLAVVFIPGRPSSGPKLVVDEPADTPAGMVWIPGGTFTMGDRRGAPHKHPEHLDVIPEHRDSVVEHEVELDGFWMDAIEVTNAEFRRFVDATDYVTESER